MSGRNRTKKGQPPPPRARAAPAKALDAVDRRMIELLGADARISITELAERVHLSRATAYARLERLQEQGILERFTIRLNPGRVGLTIAAVIHVRVRQPARDSLTALLDEMPGIDWCAFISGDHDLILIARAADMESLRDQVVWRLMQEAWVVSTQTSFVLEEVVRRSFVLPSS